MIIAIMIIITIAIIIIIAIMIIIIAIIIRPLPKEGGAWSGPKNICE